MLLIEEYEKENGVDSIDRDSLDLYKYIDWLEKQINILRIKPLSSDAVLGEVRTEIQEEVGINQANTELACGIRQGLLLAVYIIDKKISEHFR
jgi:hypothetical protein